MSLKDGFKWCLFDEYPVTENMTLVAQWKEKVYNINYVLYEDEPNDPVVFDLF